MPETRQAQVSPEDARQVLGVGPQASEVEIREAYLRAVKSHPPDRDPSGFERIRDAWQILKDPRRSVGEGLLAADPQAPLSSLLEGRPRPRRWVGPEPWLAVVKER